METSLGPAATGAGAAVVGSRVNAPHIDAVMFGTIQDFGVKDAANMGAAMAPAAAATISGFLADTHGEPGDYDLILTGDLGSVGTELLLELLLTKHNIDISKVHNDCGLMIYDAIQDVHAGGSGCGCSGSVFCSKIMNQLSSGELRKVLFVGTGALLSPTSMKQQSTTPSIAHAVLISSQV